MPGSVVGHNGTHWSWCEIVSVCIAAKKPKLSELPVADQYVHVVQSIHEWCALDPTRTAGLLRATNLQVSGSKNVFDRNNKKV
jgi:hypothetical protein